MSRIKNGIKTLYSICIVVFLILISFMPILYDNIVKADHFFSSDYILSFNDPLFSLIEMNNSNFIHVNIDDCMMTAQIGAAQIPFFSFNILIPDSCYIKDIQVIEQQFTDYSNVISEYDLLPAEEETPFSLMGEPKEITKNHSWYNIEAFQPKESHVSMGVSYMKGYPVETVHVFPMRYNPLERLLFFYSSLKVTVTFSYEDSAFSDSTNQFFRKQDNDADKVKELVINPDMVDSYNLDENFESSNQIQIIGDNGEDSLLGDSYIGGLCNADDNYKYIIITNNDLLDTNGYLYNWSDLISHHQQRDCLPGKIVTIEQIDSCIDYYNETSVFNDSAAHLREFCKDAYLDWNTEYILFGGSWQENLESRKIVPCRIMTDRDETSSYNTMPSDLYFSNLDGDWYYSSGNIWGGGRYGSNDKLSELSVGRLPVWNAEMVSNAVKKIIWYDNCNDETFLQSAGFLGGNLGWSSTSKQYMEEIRVGDGSFNEFTGFEEWNNDYENYEIDTSGRYYDEDYPTESDAVNAWKNAINNNEICLISHIDHGSYSNTLSLGTGSSLSNSNFFIGTSQACLSGRYTTGESGASTFIAKWDDRGAFAMLLNTGYGYGSSSSTAGKSQLQHKIFWDYFYANQTTSFDNWQLGHAMQYTKDLFSSYIDSYSHVYSYVWYSWNLFGDPAQQIRLNAIENTAPEISSFSPSDGSTDVSLNLSTISVFMSDADADQINWTIQTSPDIGNSSDSYDSYGERTCTISSLEYYTTYTCFVNATDGTFWTNKTFTFTTIIDSSSEKPIISNCSPENNSENIDVWIENVTLIIRDPDGDNFSYSIDGEYILSSSDMDQLNGSKTANCSIPLPFNTNITWYVNISDHRTYSVNEFFVFTTRQKYIPDNPLVFNAESINRTDILLNWTKGSYSDSTVVERNTIPLWNKDEGEIVYNGSDITFVDNGLMPGNCYYYQAWGWNVSDNAISLNFSSVNSSTINNSAVYVSNPFPVNNSINQSINLTWSIDISDAEADYIDWNISINNTVFNNSNHEGNGTKLLTLSNLSYYMVYKVYVNATDGFNQTNKWFQFRTKLPVDSSAPTISEVTFNSTNSLCDDGSYYWDQINCIVMDNFRVANVSVNITFNDNSTSNLSLSNIDETNIWSLDTNISLNGAYSVVVYATDLNGNMNHTFQKLISFTPSINMAGEHGNIDYNDMPIDINSLELEILNNSGFLCNYSVETNPNIGSKSGNLSKNESIITQVSDLLYETAYNWKISIDQGFLIYNLTFTFITTDAPEDTSNTGDSSGEGGGFMPPSLPDEPEGETNLPPETPVSPQGSCKVEIGKIQTYTVSSWDKNRDNIRFQMDWGDGRMSDWSDFVSSNESVNFTHIFADDINLNIRVRA
ncbi:MAG: hypothetical protein DRN27_08340, partial [Thermoplasmata archaeon]